MNDRPRRRRTYMTEPPEGATVIRETHEEPRRPRPSTLMTEPPEGATIKTYEEMVADETADERIDDADLKPATVRASSDTLLAALQSTADAAQEALLTVPPVETPLIQAPPARARRAPPDPDVAALQDQVNALQDRIKHLEIHNRRLKAALDDPRQRPPT